MSSFIFMLHITCYMKDGFHCNNYGDKYIQNAHRQMYGFYVFYMLFKITTSSSEAFFISFRSTVEQNGYVLSFSRS